MSKRLGDKALLAGGSFFMNFAWLLIHLQGRASVCVVHVNYAQMLYLLDKSNLSICAMRMDG